MSFTPIHTINSEVLHQSHGKPCWEHIFRFQGKKFRLLKREQSRNAPWYLQCMIAGRRFNHSLGTNVAEVAQQTAINKYIRPAREGRWGDVSKGMKGNPGSVEDLIGAWSDTVSERGESHVRRAALALLNVLRRAGYERPESVRLEVMLQPETVERWRTAVLKECVGVDQETAARLKRSANSIFATARCLLAPGALGDYQAAGLVVPDPAEFLLTFDRRRFRRVAKEVAPVDRGNMRKLIAGVLASSDRNLRLAALLQLGFGLRKGEVAQVRWEAIRVIDGGVWIDQSAAVKKGSGRLVVRGLDPFVRLLLRERPEVATGPVLVGHDTERGEEVFRRLGALMRDLGWKGQKTNHALRAFAGGEVALKFGVYQCQGWLRHASVVTTEKHYTRQWLESSGRAPRIRWARA